MINYYDLGFLFGCLSLIVFLIVVGRKLFIIGKGLREEEKSLSCSSTPLSSNAHDDEGYDDIELIEAIVDARRQGTGINLIVVKDQ